LLVVQDNHKKKALFLAASWLLEKKIPGAWDICHKDGHYFAFPGLGTYRKSRVAWLIRSSY